LRPNSIYNYALNSDTSYAQSNSEGYALLNTALGNTSGFSTNAGYYNTNNTNDKYISYSFLKAAKFFDVKTITHASGTASNIDLSNLGTVGMVIAKSTISGDWKIWQRNLTSGNNLTFNNAGQTSANAWLSVSGTIATLSSAATSGNYIIYGYAHDAAADGIIQCGSFTTDGSSNATIALGWEPQYILIKQVGMGDWRIFDNIRGSTADGNNKVIGANTAAAEFSLTNAITITATGFKVATGSGINASTTCIYMAIRRSNKPPTSGTHVYNAIARSSSSGTGNLFTVTGVGFPPDFVLSAARDSMRNRGVVDRLRGPSQLIFTSNDSAETSDTAAVTSINFDGISLSYDWTTYAFNASGGTYIYWFLKRARGFFDVVCYTGDGTGTGAGYDGQILNHNLGVAPELVILKTRSGSGFGAWPVGCKHLLPTDAYQGLLLSENVSSSYYGVTIFPPNFTGYTASTFTVRQAGMSSASNLSGATYIAYLFATLPGISKVGSYTGNGGIQNINCGFTAGARFILIKRTDAAGDWYVWDTARGIVSDNDPRISLNNTYAELTLDDSVDPYSAGFTVNQVSTNINVASATYIYLAIA
jgi:hypothetical protein